MSISAREIIAPIYDALTTPASKNVAALIESCTTAEWQSWGSAGSVSDRSHFIKKVQGFGAAIPDLAFTIQEVIAAGDKIVVRCEATGTPAGPFMGVPHGGKFFRITTIDIHTIKNGNSAEVHHVEDWMTAVAQLRG